MTADQHAAQLAWVRASLLLADDPSIRHGVYLKRKGKG